MLWNGWRMNETITLAVKALDAIATLAWTGENTQLSMDELESRRAAILGIVRDLWDECPELYKAKKEAA